MPLSQSEKKLVISMIEKVPVFSSLNRKSLETVANATTKRDFDSGETIVKKGEMATAFYLIMDGQVEVRNAKKILSKLGKGQFFGEMALFDQQPRSADVVAVEKTSCLLLSSWALEGVMSNNWNVTKKVLKELASRLRATNNALAQ